MTASSATRTAVSYQLEKLALLWPEISPLLEMHYKEIAHYQDIELEVNTDFYDQAENRGALRCYTARVHKHLVGYAVFFVKENPHYMSSLQAVQDVVFVDPVYRGTRYGVELLKFAEKKLKADGVQVVYHHMKKAHPTLGRVLEHLGYEVQDIIYSKRLDKPNGH